MNNTVQLTAEEVQLIEARRAEAAAKAETEAAVQRVERLKRIEAKRLEITKHWELAKKQNASACEYIAELYKISSDYTLVETTCKKEFTCYDYVGGDKPNDVYFSEVSETINMSIVYKSDLVEKEISVVEHFTNRGNAWHSSMTNHGFKMHIVLDGRDHYCKDAKKIHSHITLLETQQRSELARKDEHQTTLVQVEKMYAGASDVESIKKEIEWVRTGGYGSPRRSGYEVKVVDVRFKNGMQVQYGIGGKQPSIRSVHHPRQCSSAVIELLRTVK